MIHDWSAAFLMMTMAHPPPPSSGMEAVAVHGGSAAVGGAAPYSHMTGPAHHAAAAAHVHGAHMAHSAAHFNQSSASAANQSVHHRSWYMDPSHLGLPPSSAEHQLSQDGIGANGANSASSGSPSSSSGFFASQEASRYYQMHQAYESAASQGKYSIITQLLCREKEEEKSCV